MLEILVLVVSILAFVALLYSSSCSRLRGARGG